MNTASNPMGSDGASTGDEWAALLSDPQVAESGGEHNNDGVDFARYWAMYLIVALERAKHDDYALLFEYIQDVALFDSSSNPQNAHLFQLKKKDRREWSIASLCRRGDAADDATIEITSQPDLFEQFETGSHGALTPASGKPKTKKLKGQSPLGKLYLAVAKLPAHVDGLGTFVSNAPLTATMKSGDNPALHSPFHLVSLCDTDTTTIENRLKKELGADELKHLSKLSFEHTKLQPATMRETVRGALGEFLVEELKLPDTSGQLVTKLFDIFSRLSGSKQLMSSLKDIVEAKGFTKETFGKLLETASVASDFGESINAFIADLKLEGMPPMEARRIEQAARRIAIRFIRTPAERDTLRWHDAVSSARSAKEVASKYSQMVNLIADDLSALFVADGNSTVSSTDVRALALLATIHVENEPATPSA